MTICCFCSAIVKQSQGAINQAAKKGLPIYCDRVCAGLARRTNKTTDQRKSDKSAYDAQRRKDKADEIRQKKKEYFRRTYDPIKAAIERKNNMPRHIEYCRQPEYRKYKSSYDQKRRSNIKFGEFAEAHLTLMELEKEIASRITNYDIRVQNGTLNKITQRKREYERITGNKR